MPERPLSEIKPDRLETEVLKGTDEICVCRVNAFQEPADPGDIAKDCPCICYQQPKPRLGLSKGRPYPWLREGRAAGRTDRPK